MIEPTVGRVVWFYPNEAEDRGFRLSKDQPCEAHVVFVHDIRKVNLVIFTHEGVMVQKFGVPLVQDAEDEMDLIGKTHCRWMPYQVGQAKKEK